MIPIADVIERHAPALLATEGVSGVYEGTNADGAVCVRIAIVARTDALIRALPRELEGYPVEIVVTGPIGPLG